MAKLSALGFCGADNTVNPRHLALIAQSYPSVEWGILFRPDKEGQPRYATIDWVKNLAQILKINTGGKGRLAAHLCGEHVNDLLNHEKAPKIDAFLQRLHEWGFRRVQVNATAVNGVFTDNLSDDSTLQSFLRTVNAHSNMEFIVQKNEETKPLWDALMKLEKPENVVFLHDESKGTGKVADSGWCDDKEFVCTARNIVGFAGGIKPTNVQLSIQNAIEACNKSGANEFWIDMESGVRSKLIDVDEEKDIFDLAKCYECIALVCDMGLMDHPESLR